ncbi:MAG TPA: transcription antitermination factor NusB [Polyangiaceae bacterium]|jgi:N utilization substance protein B
MGARTQAREAALQMLYAVEASGLDVSRAIADFWAELPAEDADGRSYADELVRGVLSELEKTDEEIKKASQNWRLERMTRVDRNVLRIGTWELLWRRDVPRAVILDEAVEIAKRFGTEESGAFVNGVLDRVAENVGRTDTEGDATTRPLEG